MAKSADELGHEALVPSDKNLSPEWITSLKERGPPSVYRKSRGELNYIGMPVGGIGCGLIYLGGDGKLWLWDVFNQPKTGVLPQSVEVPLVIWDGTTTIGARDGAAYVAPHRQTSPLLQGFSLCVDGDIRPLDADGWEEVTFHGQYPIGSVTYRDSKCPVSIGLEGFSPFIPLDLDSSSLPATILRYTLINHGPRSVTAELAGFVENPVGLYTADARTIRVNRIRADGILCCSTQPGTLSAAAPDSGTLALACSSASRATASAPSAPQDPFNFAVTDEEHIGIGTSPLIASIVSHVTLAPGASETVTFVLSWHFPNSPLDVPDAQTGNHYAARFADAAEVAAYVLAHLDRLTQDTRLWRDTWYDSTLPHWFLDRTFASVSTLATTTFFRFGTGRFWAWEGVGCCPGTCTHVWHYAQAPGRLFPQIERDLRERVDFGIAFDEATGKIGSRGEASEAAVDGQCGRILGVLREHQMSADGAFLKRLWPKVKGGLRYLMRHDSDGDGLLDGAQENTLDAAWYGKIAWLSSLYAAAMRAGSVMAQEAGDADFARDCVKCAERTQKAIEEELFNGEYFIQKPEPGRENALGTYRTCHIDQVHGQSWAWQVGLGRVLAQDKTLSALKSLYRYNFAPDVGPFRSLNRPGRPYAMPGDAGLIMATNPHQFQVPFGNPAEWQYGYFNECMSGFEHQAASHMIAEGMVTEGLAVTRAIHDRYHAKLRNPYNEIECSDHYARAMASYGSFLTICGFECHGPDGYLAFAPRLNPESFRAAFTSAEGWGTFMQTRHGATLTLKWGRLHLRALRLGTREPIRVAVNGVLVATGYANGTITFDAPLPLNAGQELAIWFRED